MTIQSAFFPASRFLSSSSTDPGDGWNAADHGCDLFPTPCPSGKRVWRSASVKGGGGQNRPIRFQPVVTAQVFPHVGAKGNTYCTTKLLQKPVGCSQSGFNDTLKVSGYECVGGKGGGGSTSDKTRRHSCIIGIEVYKVGASWL